MFVPLDGHVLMIALWDSASADSQAFCPSAIALNIYISKAIAKAYTQKQPETNAHAVRNAA